MSAAPLTAPVNKVIPHSVVDGPGNRTAVFFQGCNLRCAYCHNPETINLCSHCGLCVAACPAGALGLEEGRVVWDETRCVGCDACIFACPHSASPKVRWMAAREVAAAAAQNRPFVRGVTVSGGECSLYRDFLLELFRETKALGLTALMDSNGVLPLAQDKELMALCGGVLLDVKAADDKTHKALTGQSNAPVLQNAVTLAQMGKLAEVRTVLLPPPFENGDTPLAVAGLLAPWLKTAPVRYQIARFRPNGTRGEAQSWPVPPLETAMAAANSIQSYGFAQVTVV